MSPLDAFKVFCVYVMCGPLEPCRSTRGDQPLLPHSHCSQLCQGVPEMPAPGWTQKGAGVTCRGDLVLSCGIGTTGGEMELPQGFVSISHFHIPTLQPGTFPLPGRGQGTVYCTPCICCITSSEQNKRILDFIALLPSGLALSLQVGLAHPSIKTPTTKPQSFQKASKTPPWLLCFPHRAPVKLFSRE